MLRKWVSITLVALCIGVQIHRGAFAEAASAISVIVDNQKVQLDTDPIIEDGTVLVEFRSLFEKLGLAVDWDPVTQTVIGRKDGLSIKLNMNSKSAYIGEREVYLQLAPRIVAGHTLVPLRFIAETTGQNVEWQEQARTIKISSQPFNEKPIYLNDNQLTAANTSDYLLGYFNVKKKNGIITTQPITLGYILGIPKNEIYFDASNSITYPTINLTVSETNIVMINSVIFGSGLTLENGVSYIPIRPIIEALGGKVEEKENGVYITLNAKK